MRPIDVNGLTSDIMTTEWINMKNAEKATFVLNLGVMTSTSNAAVTLKVADNASGTHSATITSASAACPLTLTHYHKTSSGDTLARHTVASSTFNITKSSDAKYVIIEVEAAKMGTFIKSSVTYQADYLALSVATVGARS